MFYPGFGNNEAFALQDKYIVYFSEVQYGFQKIFDYILMV